MELKITARRKSTGLYEVTKAGLSHGYKTARMQAGGATFAGAMIAVAEMIDKHMSDPDVEHVTFEIDKLANEPPQS